MPLCIALDFETSDYAPESACAIGLARIRLPDPREQTDPSLPSEHSLPNLPATVAQANRNSTTLGPDKRLDGTFYSLIRPPSSRVRFSEIHGLTWPMLKNAPTFAEIWPELAAFMAGAAFLVAHNAPFDRRVLHASCAKVGVDAPDAPFLCTLKGSRRALRLPSHTLSAVCSHCDIPLDHHHAGSDALAAATLLLRLQDMGLALDAMLVGSHPQGPLHRHRAAS